MQAYAGVFLTAALCSACFIDSGVKRSVAAVGKVALGIFGALFIITEILAFVT